MKPSICRTVLFHFHNGAGMVTRPAVITSVNEERGTIGLHVLIDVADAPSVTSPFLVDGVPEWSGDPRTEAAGDRTWSWPPRAA